MKTVLIVVLCVALFVGFMFVLYKGNVVTYNNGVCEKCGGHYEYHDCGGGKVVCYIYKCDTCGYLIETTMLFNDTWSE